MHKLREKLLVALQMTYSTTRQRKYSMGCSEQYSQYSLWIHLAVIPIVLINEYATRLKIFLNTDITEFCRMYRQIFRAVQAVLCKLLHFMVLGAQKLPKPPRYCDIALNFYKFYHCLSDGRCYNIVDV